MSMNLHVEGTRPAVVTVRGKRKNITDRVSFELEQTPTKVTNAIIALPEDSRVQGYIDYCMTVAAPIEQIPVYADDDLFGDRPPIAFEEYDPTGDHLKEFREFLEMCDREEYSVNFYSM